MPWNPGSCSTEISAPAPRKPSPRNDPPTRRVYGLYTDFVMKNPFHETDQVIKAELFDSSLMAALSAFNRKWAMS